MPGGQIDWGNYFGAPNNRTPQATYAPGAQPNPINPQSTNTGSPLNNQYNLYNAGVKQNAQNYDEIMQGYRNLLGMPSSSSLAGQFQPYTPQQYNTPQQYTPTQYQTTTRYQPVSAPGLFAQYNPKSYDYLKTGENANAISNLSNLASTGGYSGSDIADLRARGISPIRAVYANAQRNINRSRALQGGYSPNYVAATAKSAREMSDQIANQTTNVNAGIAQNVAQNKISAAPAYASATANQQAEENKYGAMNIQAKNEAARYNADIMNQIGQKSIDALNEANKFNIGQNNQIGLFNASNMTDASKYNAGLVNETNMLNTNNTNEANRYNSQTPYQMRIQGNQQDIQRQLEALQGMRGLYGTNPALANLFGNQAMSAAEFQNMINQQNQRNGLNLVSGAMR